METLNGQIERITYTSEETGFSVCQLIIKGEKKPVTIVGTIINPTPGEMIELQGEWHHHKKFGDQFKFHSYKTLIPATAFGIQKYLGSGLIKGIGPVMAKRIVKQFGTQSLDIIEHQIHKLSEVDGIGQKRIEMIQAAWIEQKEIHSVMVFLQSHGVSTAYAAKIFKTYGQESISIVQGNPYQLARDIYGIGFLTADQIAQNLGIKKEAPRRVEAGIEYVLTQLAEDGHVCYPVQDLMSQTQTMLDIDADFVSKGLKRLSEQGQVIIERVSDVTTEESGSTIAFLKRYHLCELSIASNLMRIGNNEKSIREINTPKALEWVSGQINITLAEKQEEAIESALIEKVMVITGGPGTGKTTIINAIIKILKKVGVKILLAAPTGRAAKRMSEATRENAKTIHRMLDYSLKAGGFKKNHESPLHADIVVIDEASMIDTVLMHNLLKAIPSSCTLIFVGDVNQLPSVGPGNVLYDLIESNSFKVVTLDTIFRQAQKSLIVVNAHKINEGQFPILIKDQNKKSNFYFIQKEEPEDVLSTILELVQHRIPQRFGYDVINDIQVLTPMHRGVVGAGNLNTQLQNVINTETQLVERGNRIFKTSDKVMQIRNNYDKHTYNGDIGQILKIQFDEQNVVIDFYGRLIDYSFSELDELVLAYAVSIHKSQGSEYPVVIIPVVTQHYILLQRNLIYTAVTRGKRLVVMVGTQKALAMAINTVKASKRYTRLGHRLSD